MKNTFTLKMLTLGMVGVMALPFIADAALSRTLRVGSSGTDVSELQSMLAADVSVYPQGLVTGYFGALTKAAVVRFQSQNGLSADGVVGPMTIAALQGGGMSTSGRRAPGFTGLAVSPSANSAVISFSTDSNTMAKVHYALTKVPASENQFVDPVTVTLGGASAQSDSSFKTSHSVSLNGLTSNTQYYFTIHVMDTNGESSLWSGRFVTPSM